MSIKKAVSVSIGSSTRDESTELHIGDDTIQLSRIGVDGDLNKAKALLEELDGTVDAIGLGGTNLYMYMGRKSVPIRETHQLIKNVKQTPVTDGSAVKDAIERNLPEQLENILGEPLKDKKVFLVSGVERPFLIDAFLKQGCKMTYGDLAVGLGLPIKLTNRNFMNFLAYMMVPTISLLPVKAIYPTGKQQEEIVRGASTKFMAEADIITGDFHYIRRYLPDNLKGKIIVTNTVTSDDREILKRRGPVQLFTTSPNINGRSFATNMLAAALIAAIGKDQKDITDEEYRDYAKKLNFTPSWELLET